MQAQEACVIAWAAQQQILAIGTSKGNLVLYNVGRYQKVPFMGKHTRAVLCAAWSNTDILAMGGSDKQVQHLETQCDLAFSSQHLCLLCSQCREVFVTQEALLYAFARLQNAFCCLL
ncbi:WD repeat-containing protein 19, partial [Varicellaria rhodocarpa]|nr:WD repeat-containing protein 19 [Varicellaria rhodocarpa]